MTSTELEEQGSNRDAQFLIKPEHELLLDMLQPDDDMDKHVIQLQHGAFLRHQSAARCVLTSSICRRLAAYLRYV